MQSHPRAQLSGFADLHTFPYPARAAPNVMDRDGWSGKLHECSLIINTLSRCDFISSFTREQQHIYNNYIQSHTGSRAPMRCAHAYRRTSALLIIGDNSRFPVSLFNRWTSVTVSMGFFL